MATSPRATAVLAVIRAARPNLSSPAAALAVALHAALSAEGFVLVACGEAALAEPAASLAEAGLDGWDDGVDEFAFRYSNGVLLKALAVGQKLFVDFAAAPPNSAVKHVELRCCGRPAQPPLQL